MVRGIKTMRAAAGVVMAMGLGLGAAGALAEGFSIPLVVDFQSPEDAAFYDFIGEKLAGQVADGQMQVVSSADAGSCRLATITLGQPEDVHAIYVKVTSQPEPVSDPKLLRGAGLAIRHSSADGESRFLAMLVREGGYDIVAFDNGSITQRVSSSRSGMGDGPVQIAARETSGGAEFFVNGKSVGSVGDSRINGSAVALIHCGTGTYAFDDWGLNSKGDAGLGE